MELSIPWPSRFKLQYDLGTLPQGKKIIMPVLLLGETAIMAFYTYWP